MTRNIIMDVDTGTDDAVAIMMAALRPELNLLACTTVWGNHDVADTTANTLRVLDHLERPDIPVYPGLNRPFGPVPYPPAESTFRSRAKVHVRELPLPAPTSSPGESGAIEWLIETLRAATNPVTLVPLAPLTNIATAITADPRIISAVDEVVVMGGGHAYGNVTASAEANIWHDPVAANVVFNAGFRRLVLVPLDATHEALISDTQARELARLGTRAGEAASTMIRRRISGHDATQPMPVPHSAPVHDALCIAYLLDPNVVSLRHCNVRVETVGYHTFGRTIFDVRGREDGAPNVHVAMSADRTLFYEQLRDSLALGPEA